MVIIELDAAKIWQHLTDCDSYGRAICHRQATQNHKFAGHLTISNPSNTRYN